MIFRSEGQKRTCLITAQGQLGLHDTEVTGVRLCRASVLRGVFVWDCVLPVLQRACLPTCGQVPHSASAAGVQLSVL